MTTANIDANLPTLNDLISLKGRRAVVTGAARGIGYCTARRFAQAGASVLIGDRNVDGAKQAAATLAQECKATVHGAALDVRSVTSVQELAATAERLLGGIDIWINNAGVFRGEPLVETTDEDWDAMYDVNLRGTFHGCREAARRMIAGPKRPGQVIVNIASVAAVRGRVSLGAYSAAKAGVVGLTRSLAMELVQHGIRVLSVTPSMAETPGVAEMRAAARQKATDGNSVAAMEKAIRASFPMGRAAEADEVARVIFFCVSDLAAFMTGSNVLVDGGLTTR
ncbi:MAG: SDR family oxidoreductase [Alphaproteobacteria bacterium]|nr:SDR family oxidoreductase [Alphaproteobacteria bacterium]